MSNIRRGLTLAGLGVAAGGAMLFSATAASAATATVHASTVAQTEGHGDRGGDRGRDHDRGGRDHGRDHDRGGWHHGRDHDRSGWDHNRDWDHRGSHDSRWHRGGDWGNTAGYYSNPWTCEDEGWWGVDDGDWSDYSCVPVGHHTWVLRVWGGWNHW